MFGGFSLGGYLYMQQEKLFEQLETIHRSLEVSTTKAGKACENLLNDLHQTQIEDALVPHDQFFFHPIRTQNGQPIMCKPSSDMDSPSYGIHRHAFRQMCAKVRFPVTYSEHLLSKVLEPWGANLLCENLNELFFETPFRKQGDQTAKFLVRRVGPTIRGLLSSRYGLHLSTIPLLDRFLDYCVEHQAKPVDVTASDIRVHVLCAQPFIYQPFPGQNFVMGMGFFNSDYGAGTFSVYPCVFDPARGRSMVFTRLDLSSTVSKDIIKKVHLGPMLAEDDLNTVRSDRARRTDAVALLMRDTMKTRLTREFSDLICRSIAKARDTEVSWTRVKKHLSVVLLKEEVEKVEKMLKEKSALLPQLQLDADGLPVPTNWWASQAVSYLAANSQDPDRTIDLQQEAGRFITKDMPA